MPTELISPDHPEAAAATNAQPVLPDERRLSLADHLEELRRRLLAAVAAVAVGAALSWAWVGTVIEWLKRPAGTALPQLAFFGPAEGMVVYLRVAALSGFVLALPVILHEVWGFVNPGLTPRERRYGLAFVWWGSILFVLGAAFAYGVLLPVSLKWLLGVGAGQLVPVISVSRYLSFTALVIVATGLVFELPLAVWCLARIGVVTHAALRRRWRHGLLGVVVAAAVLTPTTDVVTLLLMALPLLVLYEVSVWVARFATVRKRSV